MKNKIIFGLFGIFSLLLISCVNNIGSIDKLTKTIVFPGVERAKVSIHYDASIVLKKAINIQNIAIVNETKIQVTDYKLFNLDDKKHVPMGQIIPKGNYLLKVILPSTPHLIKSADTLAVSFSRQDSKKQYVISAPVQKTREEYRL